LEAATAAQALSSWEHRAEEIDLLLTDLVMPEGLTGRDMAERLRIRKPHLRIIYTTGYSAELRGSPCGPGEALVYKPYNSEGLLKSVRACLDAEL
jgi:CheY-like chemotaxis protein